MTTSREIPSREEVLGYLKDDVNWGRWGPDDQKGAVNMVDDAKRLRAAGLVKSGRAVSLSRGVSGYASAQQPVAGHSLHAKGPARAGRRNVHGLLRHLLSRHRDDAPGRALPRLGRQRDVERQESGRDDSVRRSQVWVGGALERRHHHTGRPAGRAAAPGDGLRYPGDTHSRLGAG